MQHKFPDPPENYKEKLITLQNKATLALTKSIPHRPRNQGILFASHVNVDRQFPLFSKST